MKKSYILFLLIAVASFTLAGCAQKENLEPVNPNEQITLKFNIKNADDVPTKALLATEDGKKFLAWENGDKIGTFAAGSFQGNQSASNNNPGTVSVSSSSYTLNVQTSQAGTITNIYSYFPYSAAAGKDKTNVLVSIPSSQFMATDVFDADAMPMAGTPVTVDLETAAANTDTPCGTINFSNLGSLIDFKIYSSVATDETLTSIKYVTSGNVAGSFSIDLTGIDSNNETTLALTASETVSEVTTTYTTHPAIPEGKANALHVYMVVAPGTYANSQVVVTTSAQTYTLTASGEKTFSRSHVKPMNVDIQSGTPGELPAEETWTKVTSVNQFTAGTYYILRGDGDYYLPNAIASSGAPACVAYTAGSAIPAAMRWTATEGTTGLVFESASHEGNYLWGWNTSNGIRVTNSSPATGASNEWTFATLVYSGTTYYTASAVSGRYLISYGTQDWRYYNSASATNIPAEFYKLDVIDNTPRFSVDSPLNATAAGGTYEVSVSRSNFSGAISVSVPSTCDWIDADNIAANADSFEIIIDENLGAARTATLTLSGTNVDEKTLVVNQSAGIESLPYSNTLIGSHEGFTINDISTGSLTTIWKDSEYGVSANANKTTSNVESYLVSPYIDLSGVANAKLTFSHGINFFADVETAKAQTSLEVRVQGGEWQAVTIPTYPSTLGNSYADAEVSLQAFAGNVIQFRFKYLATSTNPGRWQIKSLSVTEVVATDKTLTFTYSSHAGWSISSGAEDKNTYYLLKNNSYIDSPSFSFATIKSVKVTLRSFGGPQYGPINVKYGDTVIGSQDTATSTLTEYTINVTSPATGTGSLRFIGKNTTQANGPGISKIVITYTE